MSDTDTPSRPLRIFLCHSSADKPAVRELYRRLQADGFEPWLDEEDLIPGQAWQREIPRAVRKSDAVIVCLSHNSVRAGYIQKEIKFALDVADEQPEDTIFIIPLKLEECKVPDRLSPWQWVNYFLPNGHGRLLRALNARAKSLEISALPLTATEPSKEDGFASQSDLNATNQSGGINVDADQVSVGQDAVGRDKVTSAGGHIIHAETGATVIINELAKKEIESQQAVQQKAEQEFLAEQERLARQKAEAERAAQKKAVQEQRALKRAAAVAAFNQQLRKIFTRGRIFGGLIALGVLAGLYVVVSTAISRNNAASISATQTAVAIAALPLNTPSPIATSTHTAAPATTRMQVTVTDTPFSTLTNTPITIPKSTETPTETPTSTPISQPTSTKTYSPTPNQTKTPTPIPTSMNRSQRWLQFKDVLYCENTCTPVNDKTVFSRSRGYVSVGIDIIAPHLNPPSDPYTSEYYAGTALGMKVESGGQSAYVQEMAGVMFCWLGPQDFITCPMQSGVKPLPDSISIHGLPEWADGTVKFTPAIRVSRNVINNKHPNEPQRFDEHWEEGPTITINVIP